MVDAMALALEEARRAGQEGEVPVGAVILRDGEVVARGHNSPRRDRDPTAHAEIVALRTAARALGSGRRPRCCGASSRSGGAIEASLGTVRAA